MYAAIRQGTARAGMAEKLARTIKEEAIPIAGLRRRRDLDDRDRQGSDRGWHAQPHDRPSSSLASLRNNTLDRLGISLDDKMESLTAALACPAGAQSEGRNKKPPINAV